MPQFKKPATSPELRQRVFTCIDKLSDRATLSQAAADLQFLARTLPLDSLPPFLSCILSIDASSKSSVRVHCINVLSVLANTHQDLLSPHLPKTIVPALLRRLRDPDSAVRSACAASAAALSRVELSSLLWPLLGAVMTEQDGNAQIGSCVCLKASVDSAAVVGGSDQAELRRVLPKLLKLVRSEGFKAKAALLTTIASIVAVNNGGVVNGRGAVVGNVVGCAVDMLSSEDWAARKAAAEVLEAVALAAEGQSAMEVKRFVVGSLDSRRFDKVKITRETMNRALNAWKNVPGGPEEELPLSRSNSSLSKDNGSGGSSPPASRRSSFAGLETPKPKKTVTKMCSSLSDGPGVPIPSSISASNDDIIGLQTPQRKKTTSKSRSFLSDDSTITDSSSVSKSSHDGGVVTPQSKKLTSKSMPSLPDDFSATGARRKTPSKNKDGKLSAFQDTECKRSLDWNIGATVRPTPSLKVLEEYDMQTECKIVEVTTSGSEARSNFFKETSEEMVLKVRGLRPGSRVVPFIEDEESQGLVVEGGADEEVGENNTDVEDLSLIRNQLLQIERQQSNLLDLLQRFMGNSQSGINFLETRVSGLERALDEISYDLALQSGRITNNDSAASSCCPSTEFWSPKFWRRTEGRSCVSKFSCLGSVPNKDSDIEALHMGSLMLHKQKEAICRDLWRSVELESTKSVKNIGQNTERENILPQKL